MGPKKQVIIRGPFHSTYRGEITPGKPNYFRPFIGAVYSSIYNDPLVYAHLAEDALFCCQVASSYEITSFFDPEESMEKKPEFHKKQQASF